MKPKINHEIQTLLIDNVALAVETGTTILTSHLWKPLTISRGSNNVSSERTKNFFFSQKWPPVLGCGPSKF